MNSRDPQFVLHLIVLSMAAGACGSDPETCAFDDEVGVFVPVEAQCPAARELESYVESFGDTRSYSFDGRQEPQVQQTVCWYRYRYGNDSPVDERGVWSRECNRRGASRQDLLEEASNPSTAESQLATLEFINSCDAQGPLVGQIHTTNLDVNLDCVLEPALPPTWGARRIATELVAKDRLPPRARCSYPYQEQRFCSRRSGVPTLGL